MKKQIMIRIEESTHEKAKDLSKKIFGRTNFSKWIELKAEEEYDTNSN